MARSKLIKSRNAGEFLGNLLEYRKRKNPRYSLRAFAKTLGFSHSHLSEVIRGKKKLPLKTARTLAERLALGPEEINVFIELAQGSQHLDSLIDMMEMPMISKSQISVFSHWYNMVILELAKIPGVSLTPEFAAQSIGIPKIQCEKAITNLIDLGMLSVENGKITRKQVAAVRTKTSDSVIDEYSEQLLELAKKAIGKPTSTRAMGSKIFPMSSRHFSILQERIFTLIHDIMLASTRQ
jgi:uncharacterized protein (TIGR02147 family)